MRLNRLKGLVVGSLAILVMVGGPTLAAAAETSAEDSENQTAEKEGSGRLGLSTSRRHGRSELLVFQAMHGMALGFETCLILECATSEGVSALLLTSGLAGAGIGVGTSLLATRKGIKPGHAATLNSGVSWGAAYATMIGVPAGEIGFSRPRVQIGALIGGQFTGLGVAAGLYQWLEPAKGDVALVNSFGFWGTAFGIGAFTLMNEYPPAWAPFGTALAASTLAGIGGGVLSQFEPMSRGRVWTMNGAGVLGGLVGTGFGAFFNLVIQDLRYPSTLYGATAMAGTAAGLGVGAWLTDDWNRRQNDPTEPTAQLFLAPSPRGSGGMVQVSGSF
jgi:hypothetical protein